MDICEFLQSKGAYIHNKNIYDSTPIIYASINQRINLVDLLLSKGASLHDTNDFDPQTQPQAWTSVPSSQVAHYYGDRRAHGASPHLPHRLQLPHRSSSVHRERGIHSHFRQGGLHALNTDMIKI